LKFVRVRGGNFKRRALRLNVGNFAWGSENCARKTRVLDVVYNSSNNELVRTKTLVKGAIVVIDATPFRQFYEDYFNQQLGNSKNTKVIAEDQVNEKRKAKLEKRRKDHEEIEAALKTQFVSGKLLARVSSRPGQVGRVDGYVLEGPELAFYQKKIVDKKKKK
jgi:small subunit ribosomal protein S8e